MSDERPKKTNWFHERYEAQYRFLLTKRDWLRSHDHTPPQTLLQEALVVYLRARDLLYGMDEETTPDEEDSRKALVTMAQAELELRQACESCCEHHTSCHGQLGNWEAWFEGKLAALVQADEGEPS